MKRVSSKYLPQLMVKHVNRGVLQTLRRRSLRILAQNTKQRAAARARLLQTLEVMVSHGW
jgi:hypothetical protein